MLACTSLREKRVERIISATDGLVTGHLSIGLDAMLEAEELPASIADLDTSLAKVQAQDLTHFCKEKKRVVQAKVWEEHPKRKPVA
jgi:hypothetical protein